MHRVWEKNAVMLPAGQGPGKSPATIHLDLDGLMHIYRIHGWRYEGSEDPLFGSGLREALDFFDRFNVSATLFVVAEDLDDPYKRDLLKDATRRGHEIASHSLTHRKLTAMDRDSKRREIFESRERIESRLGVEVRGFRAPGFHIDRESLELIDAAGYSYDSSLFYHAKYIDTRGVTKMRAWPQWLFKDRELIEVPLPLYNPLPLPFHPCYSLVLGLWYFRFGLRRCRRMTAPLVLLFHLTDLADPVPENRLPDWKARLYTLSHINAEDKRERCEEMLKLVSKKYKLVGTSELVAMHGIHGQTDPGGGYRT